MDIVKKSLQFGYGVLSLGKESVESLAKDLQKKYDLKPETSKKLARDIIKQSMDSQKRMAKTVKAHVDKLIDDYGIEVNVKKTGKAYKKTSKKASTKKKAKKSKSGVTRTRVTKKVAPKKATKKKSAKRKAPAKKKTSTKKKATRKKSKK